MEYRGKHIEENVTNEKRTFEFELEGENTYGELVLTKEEFDDFVDKLSELRCRIDNETSDDKRIDVMLDIYVKLLYFTYRKKAVSVRNS